jgi:hypothetical protein
VDSGKLSVLFGAAHRHVVRILTRVKDSDGVSDLLLSCPSEYLRWAASGRREAHRVLSGLRGIARLVSESIASQRGLGIVIQSAPINMDASLMFSALFSLAGIGTIGSRLIRYLHWRVVFWGRRTNAASTTSTS